MSVAVVAVIVIELGPVAVGTVAHVIGFGVGGGGIGRAGCEIGINSNLGGCCIGIQLYCVYLSCFTRF